MENETKTTYYTITEEQWNAFTKRIKDMIEGTFHTNDLSTRESEEDLCFAVDTLGKEAGLPEVNWEE